MRTKEEKRILSPIKLTAFFKRNKDRVGSEEEGEIKNMETTETKVPLEEEKKVAGAPPAEAKEGGIVYAELDLVSPNMKPVVKSDDDKTEYAEIVYTAKETEDSNKKDGGTEVKVQS